MGRCFKSLIVLVALSAAAPALSQEVLVTAQRQAAANFAGYDGGVVTTSRSIINLRRTADYVVQSLQLTGDTRDDAVRKADLEATLRNVIGGASKAGVELATGDYVLQPLTLANYKSLNYSGDGRPDTSRTFFLVKVKLVPGMDMNAARTQIARFVSSVQKVGRSTLVTSGEPTPVRGEPRSVSWADHRPDCRRRSGFGGQVRSRLWSRCDRAGPSGGMDARRPDRGFPQFAVELCREEELIGPPPASCR